MQLSLRKNALTSLFKEVRVFKVVLNFLLIFILDGVHLCKIKNRAVSKAASIPARQQRKNAGPRFFGSIFQLPIHYRGKTK